MIRDFPIPSSALRSDRVAVPVRDAATVMLLRDSADGSGAGAGVEVFVFRRVASMAFAAGMLVFPGGAVEAADAGAALPWAGRPVEDFAAEP